MGVDFPVFTEVFKVLFIWIPPYSQYQQELFNIIRSLHEEQSKNFVEICNYLISKGYKSTRGKDQPNLLFGGSTPRRRSPSNGSVRYLTL